ncbi:MAG: hypothetical protein IPO35_00115 [Uliginosibacterium sp.]|nr:hypothetical protein [Uliginosibacterium sp.]
MTDQATCTGGDGVYGDWNGIAGTRSCFTWGAGHEDSDLSVRCEWLLRNVEAVAPGTHTLNFGGVLPSMVQAVTYTIIVEQRI